MSAELILDDNAERRIVLFATYKAGWDCGRGKALDPLSVQQLRSATMLKLPELPARYSVFMDDDGHLLIEWREGARDIMVRFHDDHIELDIDTTDYAALELEHMGDPDKKTGIYAQHSPADWSKAQRTLTVTPSTTLSPNPLDELTRLSQEARMDL